MEKSKLYTGGGDAGTTSLVGGERIGKSSARLEAYGTVDELSSFIGVLVATIDDMDILKELLDIQNRLFDIGGYLASNPNGGGLPPVDGLEASITEMERWIDRYDATVPKINLFVLPGGTLAASHAHVARTVCRRAERRIVELANIEAVDEKVLRYFNRMSDYFFILARYLNFIAGKDEITWQQH